MLVRCIQILEPPFRDGTPIATHPRIAVGETYLVLGIGADQYGVDYIVETDPRERPGAWPVEMFQIVDGRIPSSWAVGLDGEILRIWPRSWLAPGFWNAKMDEPETTREERRAAYAEYRRQVELMRQEAATPEGDD